MQDVDDRAYPQDPQGRAERGRAEHVVVVAATEVEGELDGIVLALRVREEVSDGAAQPEVVRMARAEPFELRTEHLGPDELLVAAKVEFDADLSIRELADVVNDVEAAVRNEVPEARVMYLEPDVLRAVPPVASEEQ